MTLISHRGNLYGSNPVQENSPGYISEALLKGYKVEIDVWRIGGKMFLGHDEPMYAIEIEFLRDARLYCHAKNIEAFEFMLADRYIHCFAHDQDKYVHTSWGIIWMLYRDETYIPKNSIQVILSKRIPDGLNCYGVCSDYVGYYAAS